jgi:hypothetical protein
MTDKLIYAIAGLIIGTLLITILRDVPDPVTYTDVIVREVQGEPDTVRTFVDRIVYRERPPTQVATQPGGGTDTVSDFCKPDTVMVVDTLAGDTVWVPADTVFLLRSVAHTPGWFFARDRVDLYGPTSAGDLRHVSLRAYPGWSVRTHPELLIREPRLGWWREAAEAGVYLTTGYLIGRIF